MKYFSETNEHINAEYERCGTIVKVPNKYCSGNENLLSLNPSVKCPCGSISDNIVILGSRSIPIVPSQPASVPKCPTCGSINVQKISKSNKVGSALLFGVFSIGHLSKTFKCSGCGYKW